VSSHTDSRSLRATSSLSQAASPNNELDQILESYEKFKPGIVAALDKRDDAGSQFETIRDNAVRSRGTIIRSTRKHIIPPNL
jgi:hypothetical protein